LEIERGGQQHKLLCVSRNRKSALQQVLLQLFYGIAEIPDA
jgi:hypothetical protein